MQKFAKRIVAVNARGHAIGEDHPRAVLTNHEVDLLLELRAEGYGYGTLAKWFEIGRSTVRDICSGRARAQHPARFKREHRRGR